MFSLALAGCGPKALPAVTARALPCPRPVAPALRPLDSRESVCSKRNETAKAANVSALRAYAEGLEATVGCYEAQVKN